VLIGELKFAPVWDLSTGKRLATAPGTK